MAIRFQPQKLDTPDLFGVRLTGVISRSDKKRLVELTEKCLANNRTNMIADLSEVGSIGGGGASILAELQQSLVAVGGEIVFVGAGEVVRHFLEPKFSDLPLRFFDQTSVAEQEFFSNGNSGSASVDDQAAKIVAAVEINPVGCVDSEDELSSAAADKISTVVEPDEVGAVAFSDEDEFSEDDEFSDGDEFSDEHKDEPLGAVSSVEPEREENVVADSRGDEADPDSALDSLLEEFVATTTRMGRRKEHRFISLQGAIEALGAGVSAAECEDLGDAIGNLLFSHSLAEDMDLLFRQEDELVSSDGSLSLAASCSLCVQLCGSTRPVTMLDITDDELTDSETSVLEQQNPDMILPVTHENKLMAILFLRRGPDNRDYSVAESFALELLMHVFDGTAEKEATSSGENATQEDTSTSDCSAAGAHSPAAVETQTAETAPVASGANIEKCPVSSVPLTPVSNSSSSLDDILLKLSVDLPDADEHQHFWRIFIRNVKPLLEIKQLAFVLPDENKGQMVEGPAGALENIDLCHERLGTYFRTIERPVAAGNMPSLFGDLKSQIQDAGFNWLLGLRYEDSFFGAVLIETGEVAGYHDPVSLIERLHAHVVLQLSRFDGQHDTADISLEFVKILVSQREKRCLGSSDITEATVSHVHLLAQEMGFPPDQERDLIYGCLLRDIALVDKPDQLMGPERDLSEQQLHQYQMHPVQGTGLLADLNLSQTIVDVVESHHERFDGQGFPCGLTGREIPLAARVVFVVENYVQMITGAHGQAAISPEDAARQLRDNKNSGCDPDLVSIFLQAVQPGSSDEKAESQYVEDRELVGV